MFSAIAFQLSDEVDTKDVQFGTLSPGGTFSKPAQTKIAMVIRVKLFTLKPSETIQICTAWLLMHDYVTGGFCLQGLWMDSSNLIRC